MSIGFLTQYYRGLGHSQRIKFIAEKTAETHDVVVMDQLFDPPIEHKVPHIAFLRDYKVSNFDNIFQFIQSDSIINLRIKSPLTYSSPKKVDAAQNGASRQCCAHATASVAFGSSRIRQVPPLTCIANSGGIVSQPE